MSASWYSYIKYAQLKSFVYKIPKDPEKRLYDFYMLTLLPHTDNENLNSVLDDAKTTLFTGLKSHLLNIVFFSLAAEFRHVFDQANYEQIEEELKNKPELKILYDSYDAEYTEERNILPEKELRPQEKRLQEDNARGYTNSYNSLLNAIEKNGVNKLEAIKLMKYVFNQDNLWNMDFGGEAWGSIADSWILLYKAKTQGELIVYIDHVYDIQHNNGTVFNKVDSYGKNPVNGDRFEWIQNALNYKASIQSPYELLAKVSRPLRKLANYILYANNKTTEEQYYKENKDAVKSHWNFTLETNPEIFNTFPSEISNLFSLEDLKKVWIDYMASIGLSELIRFWEGNGIPEEIKKEISDETWNDLWLKYLSRDTILRWERVPIEIKNRLNKESVLSVFVDYMITNVSNSNFLQKYLKMSPDIKEQIENDPKIFTKIWTRPLISSNFSIFLNPVFPKKYTKEPDVKFLVNGILKEWNFNFYAFDHMPEIMKKHISIKTLEETLDNHIKDNHGNYNYLPNSLKSHVSQKTLDSLVEKYKELWKTGEIGNYDSVPERIRNMIKPKEVVQIALEILYSNPLRWHNLSLYIQRILPRDTFKNVLCSIVNLYSENQISWHSIPLDIQIFINHELLVKAKSIYDTTGQKTSCDSVLKNNLVNNKIKYMFSNKPQPVNLQTPSKIEPVLQELPVQEQQEPEKDVYMETVEQHLRNLEKKNELV